MTSFRQADLDRFWSKVERLDNGCWMFTGLSDYTAGDYGSVYFGGRMRRAHRVSWLMHRGDIPRGEGHHGICVLHKCDNARCVNPDHLFLGTQTENVRDRDRKGRQVAPRGSQQGQAKLNEQKVLAIRADARNCREIANEYGVDRSLISLVKLGKIWKHVSGLPTTPRP